MTWTLPALGRVTSPYGPRKLVGAVSDFHAGTDIGAKRGPVYAAQDGVVRAIWQTAKGAWVVDLRHPDEGGQQIRTRYVHMYRSEITVRVGQRVRAGQQIGRSGASGTTAAHLHFEFLVNGALLDPEPLMLARGVHLDASAVPAVDVVDIPTPPVTPTPAPTPAAPNRQHQEDNMLLITARGGVWTLQGATLTGLGTIDQAHELAAKGVPWVTYNDADFDRLRATCAGRELIHNPTLGYALGTPGGHYRGLADMAEVNYHRAAGCRDRQVSEATMRNLTA